ncbi:MAG: aminoacyl-tRNA hydrolase [Candidatus Vecturithrix sp.]|jgi:PTH1 family peptidyl-tRNA hydrolase|nr:aminoacyl-tRNA hydrolase [Candidatus Vecturithrix sp.]
MWLVVGLGNPGEQYARTRHNVGFMAVDLLVRRFPISSCRTNTWSRFYHLQFQNLPVFLVQPQTYMNRSGLAVRELLDQYDLLPDHLIVIYDDLDLEPGSLRIRPHGGHGGHKGLQSVIEHLGHNDFIRVRIGIGRPQAQTDQQASFERGEVVDYVLQPFSDEELPIIHDALNRAADAIELVLNGQLDMAMNRYNRRDLQRMTPLVGE